MPIPGEAIDGDLTVFDFAEEAKTGEAGGESEDTENEMGSMNAGDDVEEVDGGGGPLVEGEALAG